MNFSQYFFYSVHDIIASHVSNYFWDKESLIYVRSGIKLSRWNEEQSDRMCTFFDEVKLLIDDTISQLELLK